MYKKILQLLKDTFHQMQDGELRLVATSLAFATALALIPFLAVVLATFQHVTNLEALYPQVEAFLLSHFKVAVGGDATKWIRILLRNIQHQSIGITGAIFLILTSLRLLHEMDSAIHRVWAIQNSRPIYKRIFAYWLLMVLIPIGLAIYVGLGTLSHLHLPGFQRIFPEWLSNNALLFGILFLVSKYVPAHKVRNSSAFWGALFAGIGIATTQKIFKLLATQVFTYSKIYGSLVTLPLVLIWLLTLWYAFLAGIAITASLEKKKIIP